MNTTKGNPPNTVCKREKEGGENGNTMEEMNLFKVHCTHVWNYHNEILSYY
jgi:hypothetical protein